MGLPLVPGDPQDVKVQSINSTAIHVQWKPPVEKERNGIIRGYHIHVQETREEVSTLILIFQILKFLYNMSYNNIPVQRKIQIHY